MMKYDLSAVVFLTLTELIGCVAVAVVLGMVFGCNIGDVITLKGSLSLLSLCLGMSIIGVALSHRPRTPEKKRRIRLKEKGA